MMNEIASVAAQIQDRALILAAERDRKVLAEQEHAAVKLELEKEKKTNDAVRRKLLQVTRNRHGIELELFRLHEQEEEKVERNKALAQERDDLKARAQKLEEEWKKTVLELQGPHEAKRELYQRSLEGLIQQRQQNDKLEQDRLDFFERRIREMVQDEQDMVTKIESIEEETKATNDRENREDEAVSNVAMKIKEELSKRSALRRTHQQAKNAYQSASEEMIKWENECIASSSR